MNKYLRRAALMIPPVKKLYKKVEDMRSFYELQIGRQTYYMNQLDELFERNVMSSWEEEPKQFVCTQPFNSIFVTEDEIYTCCSDHLKYGFKIGDTSDSFKNIWNSDVAKKLRYSVLHGNYEYCNNICPKYSNPENNKETMLPRKAFIETSPLKKDVKSWEDYSLNTTPTTINLACNRTCNLHCVSCRNHVIANTDEENERINHILENIIRPALKNCTLLIGLGGGEFFASKPVQSFYRTLSVSEYPNLKLNIITNGILFTPSRWSGFSNLKGMVDTVSVSIDAATKKTYESIRRGGKWEILNENMEYISSLRQSNEIKRLNMNFVVQKSNFSEMIAFVEWAKRLKADCAFFGRLSNWGTISAEAHAEADVFSSSNPHYNDAVKKLLTAKKETGIVVLDNCMA